MLTNNFSSLIPYKNGRHITFFTFLSIFCFLQGFAQIAGGSPHEPGEDQNSFLISSYSSDAELRAIAALAKARGVEVDFRKLLRNSEGIITEFQASLLDEENSQTTTHLVNNEDGIGSFFLVLAPEGKACFKSITGNIKNSDDRKSPGGSSRLEATSADSTESRRRSFYLSESRSVYFESPLVIIDGEKKPADFDVNSIPPENIKSVHVLKGNSATAKYGNSAKGGAIELKLKE